MSRLTNPIYINIHHHLKQEWSSEGGGAFCMLGAREQWDLHAYFAFTKNFNDEQLIVHRTAITDKSLPQRAGRALNNLVMFTDRLEVYRRTPREPAPKRKRNAKRKIHIFSVVNPDLDPEVFAKVLIEAGLAQAAAERAEHLNNE